MGRFVQPADVTDRYEGTFPADRSTWLDKRIDDVEADLILMVPSLDVTDVGQIAPTRLQKVVALVADKVLELYRNPERARTRTETAGPYSDSTTFDSGRTGTRGYFTDDEVANIRLRTKRSNLGVAHVKPSIPRDPRDPLHPW
ncbi:hypothetical protein A5677_16895 [Mycobacterium malmoense]|uniref:Head-to-tail adaptor n=1 Tax=Mycobacterium malmoense TaxID=1780 RepID=A0A1B9DA53_MYCMA|nr:hypothetical protein [Mycobacterium malmoense]OCB57642.1 hypothetical protein A5677_16895 [Mycobacterium malmoense]